MNTLVTLVAVTMDYALEVFGSYTNGNSLSEWRCESWSGNAVIHGCGAKLATLSWFVLTIDVQDKHIEGAAYCPDCIRKTGQLLRDGIVRDVYTALGLVG